MLKRNLIIIVVIALGAGLSISLGIIFWYNPLGSKVNNLEPGTILLKGSFIEFDASHYGRGTVQVVVTENDNLILQFINVDIANGPDLFVYLSDKSTFSGIHDSPGNYEDLGYLPYNSGNFSLNIRGVSSLDNINSVLIWCRQFSVAFTYATLT